MHDNRVERSGANLLDAAVMARNGAGKSRAARLFTAAQTLVACLEEGAPMDSTRLRAAMTAAFDGQSDQRNAWAWKEAYDAAEAAVVLFMQRYGRALLREKGRPRLVSRQLAHMQRIEELEPSATKRSETQTRLQQFSTPTPLAWAAARAAMLEPGDQVLEPSAGTGILAQCAANWLAGGAGGRLLLNELGSARSELLGWLFPGIEVGRYNGEQINDHMPHAQPTVVVMNPPFSRSPGRESRQNDADLRHLRAAYAALQPGGRLVAITAAGRMPGNDEWRQVFETAEIQPAVAFTAKIDGKTVYRRRGTTTDCRLTVLDRPAAAGKVDSIIDRENETGSVEQLVKLLSARLRPRLKLGGGAKRPTRASIPAPLRKPRRGGARRAETRPAAHQWGPVERLAYTAVGEQKGRHDAASAGETYQPWRPETLRMARAIEHPTPLVQSRAMAAVNHPPAVYRPVLPIAVTEKGKLSEAQLESVVLAGQSGEHHLKLHQRIASDWSTSIAVDENGRPFDEEAYNAVLESGVMLSEHAVRLRQGWMLGDGTGAGKGRQVAGIILDNWLQGRRRALWLSQSATLIDDARRDWVAIGGDPAQVIALNRIRCGEPIEAREGVLFATYATLRSTARSERLSRLDQIVEWLTGSRREADRLRFSGAIIFDESHAMQNAAGGQGNRGRIRASAQGIAGLRLQNALPDARVVYVSATGATTIEGLAYATRLGLWNGGETPFTDRESFCEVMTAGGVAALEIVSRDLKSLGLYQARALSFDGVEIEMLVHELSSNQRQIYNEYADAFGIIHTNIQRACELTGIIKKTKTQNPSALGAALSTFEATKVRFFNHLLTGMQTPSVIEEIEKVTERGESAVVQLVSTGEALMERRLEEIPPGEWKDLSIDLTPREYVLEYLQHSFPTQLQEERCNEDGDVVAVPVVDADGKPVVCQEAAEARDRLIRQLASLPPVPTALDQLIHHFGHEAVAEITGRHRRTIRTEGPDGPCIAVQTRSATANTAETEAFMEGPKRILVFSKSGGIGVSYHADRSCSNRTRRNHFMLEPGWEADRAVQGLGRSHRSHQVSAPRVIPVTTDVRGQRRYISTIAKRIDSLGAITRGQRNSQAAMSESGASLFRESDNFESVYAHKALAQFYGMLYRCEIQEYTPQRFKEATGLSIETDEGGMLEKLPPMHRLLNRLLALRIEEQNRLFTVLEALIEGAIEQAIEAGTYNRGVEEIRAESISIGKSKTLYTDPRTGGQTQIHQLRIRRRRKKRTADDAVAEATRRTPENQRYFLVVNDQSKRAGVVIPAASWFTKEGMMEARVRVLRPGEQVAMSKAALRTSRWRRRSEKPWRKTWDAEVEALGDFHEEKSWMVTGLLLPIWNRLPNGDMRVRRVTTDEGQPLIGRVLRRNEAEKTLSEFGVENKSRQTMTAEEMWESADQEGRAFQLRGGLRIRKRRVMGIPRIEVEHAYDRTVDRLRKLGCRTEVLNYHARVFVPSAQILARVVKQYPATERGA